MNRAFYRTASLCRVLAVSSKRVARLMRTNGLQNVTRRKGSITTIPDRDNEDKPDRVERNFAAEAADQLYALDITYIPSLGAVSGHSFRRLLPAYGRLIHGRAHLDPDRPRRAGDGVLAALQTESRKPPTEEGYLQHSICCSL